MTAPAPWLPGRRWVLAFALALCAIANTGCTAVLWNWASRPRIDGELIGVLRQNDTEDLIVYRLGEESGHQPGYYVLRVPHGMDHARARRITDEQGHETLELETAVRMERFVSDEEYDTAWFHRIEQIPARKQLARIRMDRPEESDTYADYRVHQTVGEDGKLRHDFYAYSTRYRAWARIGAAKLGDPQRYIGTAIALTPFTVAGDALLAAAAILGGGGPPIAGAAQQP